MNPTSKLRLAYVVDSELPSLKANTVHALKMCSAFSEHGADVTLYCKTTNETDIKAFLSANKNVFSDVKYIIPTKRGGIPGVHLIIDALNQAKAIKANHEVDYVYARARLTPLFLLRFRQFIFEAHEWPSSFFLKHIEKTILRSKNCLGLVVINDALKNKYTQEYRFLPPSKVHVLRDGANKAHASITPKTINNARSVRPDCVIGYLGHLYPGKCMEIIIELAKKRPGYLFHIVGGTAQWVSYWQKELDKNNLKNVILYGYINNDETDAWYSAFDVFLLPILGKIEVDGGKKRDIGKWTSPLKLFEAMAYGKAILASRVGPLQEVINEEEDCLMANPNDIEEWCTQLDRYVDSKDLRDTLGDAAKSKLEAQYTWSIRAKRVLNLLQS